MDNKLSWKGILCIYHILQLYKTLDPSVSLASPPSVSSLPEHLCFQLFVHIHHYWDALQLDGTKMGQLFSSNNRFEFEWQEDPDWKKEFAFWHWTNLELPQLVRVEVTHGFCVFFVVTLFLLSLFKGKEKIEIERKKEKGHMEDLHSGCWQWKQ